MKISRDVILDLLPLYLANEASQESRRLVEAYLAQDPDLQRLAAAAEETELPAELPATLSQGTETKALQRARRLMFQHNLFLLLAVTFTILFVMGATFLWDDHPLGPILFLLVAGAGWFAFWVVNRRLSE